jgi:hypothetical protein
MCVMHLHYSITYRNYALMIIRRSQIAFLNFRRSLHVMAARDYDVSEYNKHRMYGI